MLINHFWIKIVELRCLHVILPVRISTLVLVNTPRKACPETVSLG